MKIFITGNMGYVGPVVATHLREKYPEGVLIGCDTGFFAGCLIDPLVFPEVNLSQQILTDVRQLSQSEMTGVDAVVHLAAISNDPMGRSYETVTDQINYRTSVEIARKAKMPG